MFDLIKDLVPRHVKQNPNGPYNLIRKLLGVSRYGYNLLRKEIENNEEISRLFPESKMRKHYVLKEMRQSVEYPVIFVNQIRYYRMYKFFQKNYPVLFDKETKIVNVGDTSGILLRTMGKNELSVNINKKVVESMKENALKAEVQDAENLKYRDKTFDYGFCFQCLEHLKNPLKALDELGRVVKKRVFLSIPYVKRTYVFNKRIADSMKKTPIGSGPYGAKEVLDGDCHIFEFSTKDMLSLLNFTQLEYIDSFPINYFTPLGTTRKPRGTFFNFFILKPRD